MKSNLSKLFTGIVASFLLASVLTFTGCGGDDSTPAKQDTTDDGGPIQEFVQWNDYRLNSDKFRFKQFDFVSEDSILIVDILDPNIPAHEFRLSYSTESFSDFKFEEGDFKPNWIGLEQRTIGLNVFGYSSGTGKFASALYRPYEHCKIYKNNGDWVIDFKNVVVKDLADSTWQGKVSGVIVWKAP